MKQSTFWSRVHFFVSHFICSNVRVVVGNLRDRFQSGTFFFRYIFNWLLKKLPFPYSDLIFIISQADRHFLWVEMHDILNQLDESICLDCLLLAPAKDSPRARNDCTHHYGYSIPPWFEYIISIINTSVACEDFSGEGNHRKKQINSFPPSKKHPARISM